MWSITLTNHGVSRDGPCGTRGRSGGRGGRSPGRPDGGTATDAGLAVDDPAVGRFEDRLAGRGARPDTVVEHGVTGGGADGSHVDPGLGDQTLHLTLLVRQREGDDRALLTGAGRAARPVQVVLVVGRRVDLQDHGDVVDVDATGGDVGGHEDRDGPGLERGEHAIALALVEPAVQRDGHDTLLAQLQRHAIGAELGAHEHDGAAGAVGDLGGNDLLVHRVDEQHVVLHRRDARRVGVGRVGDRVDQVAVHDLVDAAVQRRREQQALPTGGHQVEDLGDLLEEAHLGHVVGLVEDRDLDVAQVGRAALDQVAQATRRGDEDVEPAGQRLDLRRVGHATRDELVPQAHDVHQRRQRVADLHGQLTGRHQDDGAHLTGRGVAAGQPGDRRQPERQGLARAGLTAAEDVLARQRVREGRGLDRERLGDAVLREALDQRHRQAQGLEAVVVGHRHRARGVRVHVQRGVVPAGTLVEAASRAVLEVPARTVVVVPTGTVVEVPARTVVEVPTRLVVVPTGTVVATTVVTVVPVTEVPTRTVVATSVTTVVPVTEVPTRTVVEVPTRTVVVVPTRTVVEVATRAVVVVAARTVAEVTARLVVAALAVLGTPAVDLTTRLDEALALAAGEPSPRGARWRSVAARRASAFWEVVQRAFLGLPDADMFFFMREPTSWCMSTQVHVAKVTDLQALGALSTHSTGRI
ncbi:hypothetical protein GCM10025862_06270 [Arsenicicoccus piscis]|uniref:Uncharacterized protein n=1 Tax=Arsenicicoccus piscis TaxID=673954 RepID=A0ABQ6HJC8_9MICO|nr:hypothetical protein GCM10025862_06270 [Arsenicicoccus piscis]